MKIKLDENLPAGLMSILESLGNDVHSVSGEGLTGESDIRVWAAAQNEQRFLITQDLDFSDVRKFRPGHHAGVLLVRLRIPSRNALLLRVHQLFESEAVREWAGCFVVVTEHKIRVLRPNPD